MSAYWPHSLAAPAGIIILLLALLFSGYLLARQRKSAVWGWPLVGLSVVIAHLLSLNEPAGFRMLALCGPLLYAMKIVVLLTSQRQHDYRLGLKQWLGFAVLWPGMNPLLFAETIPAAADRDLLRRGCFELILGLVFILLAHWLWPLTQSKILLTVLLLPGLSLTVHFGLFNLAAYFWQRQGVACQTLFRAPLLATSLTDFWGQRWNLAFSEMTRIAIYQPLNQGGSKAIAAWAAFAFSGVLHELAISFAVQAAYGLPLLYFLIHGLLMAIERQLYRQGRPIDKNPLVGRCWTILCLVIPVPLLFHLPFLSKVVWPIGQ